MADFVGQILLALVTLLIPGLWAWLRRTYGKLVSIDASLAAIGGQLAEILGRLDRHEARLDQSDLAAAEFRGMLRREG